jgi:hypothetical protein
MFDDNCQAEQREVQKLSAEFLLRALSDTVVMSWFWWDSLGRPAPNGSTFQSHVGIDFIIHTFWSR